MEQQLLYHGLCKARYHIFGYEPKTIQTDNVGEFTHFSKTKCIHPFYIFCARNYIKHKLISPRRPWHNKTEDREKSQERLETFLQLFELISSAYLQEQMKRYLRRSDSIPMAVLDWKFPVQNQKELEYLSS